MNHHYIMSQNRNPTNLTNPTSNERSFNPYVGANFSFPPQSQPQYQYQHQSFYRFSIPSNTDQFQQYLPSSGQTVWSSIESSQQQQPPPVQNITFQLMPGCASCSSCANCGSTNGGSNHVEENQSMLELIDGSTQTEYTNVVGHDSSFDVEALRLAKEEVDKELKAREEIIETLNDSLDDIIKKMKQIQFRKLKEQEKMCLSAVDGFRKRLQAISKCLKYECSRFTGNDKIVAKIEPFTQMASAGLEESKKEIQRIKTESARIANEIEENALMVWQINVHSLPDLPDVSEFYSKVFDSIPTVFFKDLGVLKPLAKQVIMRKIGDDNNVAINLTNSMPSSLLQHHLPQAQVSIIEEKTREEEEEKLKQKKIEEENETKRLEDFALQKQREEQAKMEADKKRTEDEEKEKRELKEQEELNRKKEAEEKRKADERKAEEEKKRKEDEERKRQLKENMRAEKERQGKKQEEEERMRKMKEEKARIERIRLENEKRIADERNKWKKMEEEKLKMMEEERRFKAERERIVREEKKMKEENEKKILEEKEYRRTQEEALRKVEEKKLKEENEIRMAIIQTKKATNIKEEQDKKNYALAAQAQSMFQKQKVVNGSANQVLRDIPSPGSSTSVRISGQKKALLDKIREKCGIQFSNSLILRMIDKTKDDLKNEGRSLNGMRVGEIVQLVLKTINKDQNQKVN